MKMENSDNSNNALHESVINNHSNHEEIQDGKNISQVVRNCDKKEEDSSTDQVQKSSQVQYYDGKSNGKKGNEENNVISEEKLLLDRVQNLPAIFQSQQMDDPDLTVAEKRKIAEELLKKNPVNFLIKFGEYLEEEHLNYFLDKYSSYEIEHYVKNFKNLLIDRNKKILKKNRRYEAMKKLESEGSYFSEIEMEKREPLLYHQMVGQFLTEKEKIKKNRQAHGNVIPTFSNFLINKMDRDELDSLVKAQQEEENKMDQVESSNDEEMDSEIQEKRWGEDWEDEVVTKKVKKKPKKQKVHISSKEKVLLLEEFKSIMKSNFLNGKDSDFDYSEVDLNPEYDSVDIRTQDEEEKYFDEESYDGTVCTDTGIEDY